MTSNMTLNVSSLVLFCSVAFLGAFAAARVYEKYKKISLSKQKRKSSHDFHEASSHSKNKDWKTKFVSISTIFGSIATSLRKMEMRLRLSQKSSNKSDERDIEPETSNDSGAEVFSGPKTKPDEVILSTAVSEGEFPKRSSGNLEWNEASERNTHDHRSPSPLSDDTSSNDDFEETESSSCTDEDTDSDITESDETIVTSLSYDSSESEDISSSEILVDSRDVITTFDEDLIKNTPVSDFVSDTLAKHTDETFKCVSENKPIGDILKKNAIIATAQQYAENADADYDVIELLKHEQSDGAEMPLPNVVKNGCGCEKSVTSYMEAQLLLNASKGKMQATVISVESLLQNEEESCSLQDFEVLATDKCTSVKDQEQETNPLLITKAEEKEEHPEPCLTRMLCAEEDGILDKDKGLPETAAKNTLKAIPILQNELKTNDVQVDNASNNQNETNLTIDHCSSNFTVPYEDEYPTISSSELEENDCLYTKTEAPPMRESDDDVSRESEKSSSFSLQIMSLEGEKQENSCCFKQTARVEVHAESFDEDDVVSMAALLKPIDGCTCDFASDIFNSAPEDSIVTSTDACESGNVDVMSYESITDTVNNSSETRRPDEIKEKKAEGNNKSSISEYMQHSSQYVILIKSKVYERYMQVKERTMGNKLHFRRTFNPAEDSVVKDESEKLPIIQETILRTVKDICTAVSCYTLISDSENFSNYLINDKDDHESSSEPKKKVEYLGISTKISDEFSDQKQSQEDVAVSASEKSEANSKVASKPEEADHSNLFPCQAQAKVLENSVVFFGTRSTPGTPTICSLGVQMQLTTSSLCRRHKPLSVVEEGDTWDFKLYIKTLEGLHIARKSKIYIKLELSNKSKDFKRKKVKTKTIKASSIHTINKEMVLRDVQRKFLARGRLLVAVWLKTRFTPNRRICCVDVDLQRNMQFGKTNAERMSLCEKLLKTKNSWISSSLYLC